jgi:hypothetical protein
LDSCIIICFIVVLLSVYSELPIANLASHSIKKAKNGNNRIFTNGSQ